MADEVEARAEAPADLNEEKQRGVCAIKAEFIIKDHVRLLAEECLTEADKAKVAASQTVDPETEEPNKNGEEPEPKKIKLDDKKDKLRGQNKARPPPYKAPREANICPWLVDQADGESERKCDNKRCQFMHDRAEYMKIKPPDIAETCFFFDTMGRCPRGTACRMGARHLTETGLNIVDEAKFEEYKKRPLATKNQLPKALQNKLRKHKYNFSKAEKIVKANNAAKKDNKDNGAIHATEIKIEKPDESEIVALANDENLATKPDDDSNFNIKVEDSDNAMVHVTEIKIEKPDESEIVALANDENLATKPDDDSNLNIKVEDSDNTAVHATEIKIEKPDESEIVALANDENLATKPDDSNLNIKVEDSVDSLAAENDVENAKNPKNPETNNETVKIGPASDYDIVKQLPSERKKIDWKDKLLLSPLTTVGNLPFRRICKEYGADFTCGEMALAPKILKGANEEWALVKRHESEDIFGVQICGNNPGVLTRCAQLLEEEVEVDFIDLNLGCPIDLIYRQGGGSGMLNKLNVLENTIKSITKVMQIPLTVKTRMGVYMEKPVAHKLTPLFRDWGASMITVHGRSREQRYTKMADWEYIEMCANGAKPIPIYGNGDILSFDDYKKAREICPSIQGVTIGRGALIKPWIFTEIKEQKLTDVSSSERFEIVKKYAKYGLEHWGSDTRGVETTRRFMLEWMSFLHRYIPVGILERPPQKINERPPYFRGRDEMETLMASSNCADWIKISEMLLGKVPDGFHFLPKHKANSWK